MTDNSEQRDYWTDAAGPKWLRHQADLDALMQPVLDGVLSRANLQTGARVLDIGCGAGNSTVQAADAVGPEGHATGADISETLLGRARDLGQGRDNIEFILADAASHEFAPQSFDNLISRFGVMFFADPEAAFSNMAKALKSGSIVTFAAWGQIPENPFFTYPAQAARAVLGATPKSDPDAPGPFAFRDPARVEAILSAAGLAEIGCDTQTVHLTPQGGIADFAELCLGIGPASMAITHFEADAAQIAALRDMVIDVFAPFDGPEGLRIPAQINFFTATKP